MVDPTANLGPGRLSPTALSLADAARLLSAAGGQAITVAMLQADVVAGAPTSTDGTINLVHYAAWLVRQSVVGSPESGGTPPTPGSAAQRSRLQTPDYGLSDAD